MKIVRLLTALALLLFAGAAPSQAILFVCQEDCSCQDDCTRACWDSAIEYPSTCGGIGVCYGMCRL
jgi:hypothetical protein